MLDIDWEPFDLPSRLFVIINSDFPWVGAVGQTEEDTIKSLWTGPQVSQAPESCQPYYLSH